MLDTPSETIPLQRARGEGRIVTRRRGDATALDQLYQDGCAKIRLPKIRGAHAEAVLINTAGGLTGSDRMDWGATAGEGSHLVMTTQACERIYRSVEGAATVHTALHAGPGARIDWLPQETILFDRSSLRRRLEVDLSGNAVFLGLEAVIIGRAAHGDAGLGAAISDQWRVRRDGRLIHAEASRLDAHDLMARGNPALLGGAGAFATILYAAEDASRHMDGLKSLLAPHRSAGISCLGQKLVMRALAPSGMALREIVMPVIAALATTGAVPKLWSL